MIGFKEISTGVKIGALVCLVASGTGRSSYAGIPATEKITKADYMQVMVPTMRKMMDDGKIKRWNISLSFLRKDTKPISALVSFYPTNGANGQMWYVAIDIGPKETFADPEVFERFKEEWRYQLQGIEYRITPDICAKPGKKPFWCSEGGE